MDKGFNPWPQNNKCSPLPHKNRRPDNPVYKQSTFHWLQQCKGKLNSALSDTHNETFKRRLRKNVCAGLLLAVLKSILKAPTMRQCKIFLQLCFVGAISWCVRATRTRTPSAVCVKLSSLEHSINRNIKAKSLFVLLWARAELYLKWKWAAGSYFEWIWQTFGATITRNRLGFVALNAYDFP